VDSATSAGGALAAAGLEKLAVGITTGGSGLPLLKAASRICSYLGTPGKSWQATLFPFTYLRHLPASSSVAIFAAATRGLSLQHDLDVVKEPHLPACGPAELVTLAEVGNRVQQPLLDWGRLLGAISASLGLKTLHLPYSNAWWRLWRDCVCAMAQGFSSEIVVQTWPDNGGTF
jgi:hypothetical protein